MTGLDSILQLLMDEEWHDLPSLAEEVGLTASKLRTIIISLSEHGFVQYRETDQVVKIEPRMKELIQTMEG